MEAYSVDLRERVLLAVDEGIDTREEIAEAFGVSTRWVRKLVHQVRETGSIEPLSHGGGRRPTFTRERLERLKKLVEKKPAATLDELRKSSRVPCCEMTVSRALRQLGYTRKKRHFTPVSKSVPR